MRWSTLRASLTFRSTSKALVGRPSSSSNFFCATSRAVGCRHRRCLSFSAIMSMSAAFWTSDSKASLRAACLRASFFASIRMFFFTSCFTSFEVGGRPMEVSSFCLATSPRVGSRWSSTLSSSAAFLVASASCFSFFVTRLGAGCAPACLASDLAVFFTSFLISFGVGWRPLASFSLCSATSSGEASLPKALLSASATLAVASATS
mmetsp:Transcript_5927/g.13584  ORF Transcript_5927/g.13584 Transcript_5927/m.13584 type:complete len:206 (-) Transcript_5927:1495-2112(-)